MWPATPTIRRPASSWPPCYAFQRKKHLEKRLAIGQGLVGQTYLEGQTLLLTEVPPGYTSITSGLGDATPTCLAIVPLKHQGRVEAILELAAFRRFDAHELTFLEKAGEFIAAITWVAVAERTQQLLGESRQRAEAMSAQEEEMRQSMEELEATQEEMRRKEHAHLDHIEQLTHLHEANTVELQQKSREMTGVLTAVDSTLATIEFDLQGKVLTANEAFLQVIGYSLREIAGQSHRMFLDETYAQSEAYGIFWQQLRLGRSQTGEVRRRTKAGQEIWLTASYTPVVDEKGQPVKVIKFAQDITAQKFASLDWQSQLQALSKSNAVVEFDLQGCILAANEAFLSLMNYSWEAVAGQHHRLLVSGRERDSADYAAFWDQLRRGVFVSGEFQRLTSDGCPVWIKGSYNPILDPNGHPYKVVKYAQDITAQKQLERESLQQTEELRAQEEEIRQNLEEMQASQEEVERKSIELEAHLTAINRTLATIEFSMEGRILTANDKFLAMMGYQAEQLFQQPHGILVEDSYRRSPEYTSFWEQLRAGTPQVGKVKRLTKEGQEV